MAGVWQSSVELQEGQNTVVSATWVAAPDATVAVQITMDQPELQLIFVRSESTFMSELEPPDWVTAIEQLNASTNDAQRCVIRIQFAPPTTGPCTLTWQVITDNADIASVGVSDT